MRQVEVLLGEQVRQGDWHMVQALFWLRKVLGKQVRHWAELELLHVLQLEAGAQGTHTPEERKSPELHSRHTEGLLLLQETQPR